MKATMRWAWLAVAVLGAGCDRPAEGSPEAAWHRFALALRRGDARAAYAGLSRETRALAETRARQISEASKGLVKNEPALMLFQAGTRPAPPGRVTVVEVAPTSAVLEVTGEAGTQRVKLVKDGEQWLVDLSQTL